MTCALTLLSRKESAPGGRELRRGPGKNRTNDRRAGGEAAGGGQGGRAARAWQKGQSMSEAELEQRKNELLAKLRAKTPALRK